MSEPSVIGENHTVSAPGKLMLSGEYAVLDGAEAVLIAVGRRARARLEKTPQQLSPFLQAIREELAETTAFGGVGRAALEAARRVVVDTGTFHAVRGEKLGLGSSAAVTVAAVGCVLAVEPDKLPIPLIHRLAHNAHGNAQATRGARGSGADVAACTYGGVIAVSADRDPNRPVSVRPLTWPSSSTLVSVWTGQAADTPSLVAKVRNLRIGDRQTYNKVITAISDASATLVDALERADSAAVIAAFERGGQATTALGKAAGISLALPVHDKLATLARTFGGASKPTGAGGGDIAIAAFADADKAAAFTARVRADGLTVLDDLTIADTGVRVDGVRVDG